MKIEIVSMWYNEEFLAPFFLKHYSWVDSITLLLDVDTSDKTREIVEKDGRVNIIDWKFPRGMDDALKVNVLNETIHKSTSDWVILVDADELVFRPKGNIRRFIEDTKENIIRVGFWQVYRHSSERDLDSNLPAIPQRVHGDSRFGYSYGQDQFIKPIVFRPLIQPTFAAGNHSLYCEAPLLCEEILHGSHWCMMDVDFAVNRRINNRRNRMSIDNRIRGFTVQHWGITEQDIINECSQHLNDEVVIKLEGDQP